MSISIDSDCPRSPNASFTAVNSPSTAASSAGHHRGLSEDLQPSDDGKPQRSQTYHRNEEPPRNADVKMICKHEECDGISFDRKREWGKHMNKHDRPYKCNTKGCEKLQGFTYSGGLLRHKREVHKMHGGTKKSLFCPFPDCAEFMRRENLTGHVRRIHDRTSLSPDLRGLVIRRDMVRRKMERFPVPDLRPSESPCSQPMESDRDTSLKRKRDVSQISAMTRCAPRSSGYDKKPRRRTRG